MFAEERAYRIARREGADPYGRPVEPPALPDLYAWGIDTPATRAEARQLVVALGADGLALEHDGSMSPGTWPGCVLITADTPAPPSARWVGLVRLDGGHYPAFVTSKLWEWSDQGGLIVLVRLWDVCYYGVIG